MVVNYHGKMFNNFVQLFFSMKLTHLSPVQHWFIQSYEQVFMHNGSVWMPYWLSIHQRIFTHLATLFHLAILLWLRALTLSPPTPFQLWPLGHKRSRTLSGLTPLLIYQDIHWCLYQRTVYILYVLQISRVQEAKLFCDAR